MSGTSAPATVLVVGTGGLACAFSAWLARAGAAVSVTGGWTEALAAIAARGVTVHENGSTWRAPVRARPVGEAGGAFPLALVLVKSGGTARAAAAVAGALAPGGLAVTLQNGLGNREILEDTLGAGRVLAGVAFMGALVVAPGEVRVLPGRVALDGGHRRVDEAAAVLRRAGVVVELAEPFEQVAWTKLAANCAVNALSALRGVPNGALLEDCVEELRAAAREVAAVAAARGIALPADAAELTLAVVRATAANRSSMLQDLERGAGTEVDALNGAVVRAGRALGVPTPANERLWRLVRAREGRPLDDDEATGRP